MEKNFANTHNRINKKDHPNLLNNFYYIAKLYAYTCLIFVNSIQKKHIRAIVLVPFTFCQRCANAKGLILMYKNTHRDKAVYNNNLILYTRAEYP